MNTCKIAEDAIREWAETVAHEGEEVAQANTEAAARGKNDAAPAWAEAARHYHDEGCAACAAAAQI